MMNNYVHTENGMIKHLPFPLVGEVLSTSNFFLAPLAPFFAAFLPFFFLDVFSLLLLPPFFAAFFPFLDFLTLLLFFLLILFCWFFLLFLFSCLNFLWHCLSHPFAASLTSLVDEVFFYQSTNFHHQSGSGDQQL